MKKFLLLLLLCGYLPAHAQTLKRYAIGRSGCSASFYCNPGKFEESTSPDSSVIYSGECTLAGATYELICVKLVQAAPSLDMAEGVLEQYLDFLKGSYEVTGAAGYAKGLKLPKKENTRGMMDTWRDKDNNYLKVKGWTNGKYIAVLMIVSAKEVPAGKASAYLDSVGMP